MSFSWGYLSIGQYAEYSEVEAAIVAAEAIDPDDVVDYTAVQAAINAVVYYRDIADQTYVNNCFCLTNKREFFSIVVELSRWRIE